MTSILGVSKIPPDRRDPPEPAVIRFHDGTVPGIQHRWLGAIASEDREVRAVWGKSSTLSLIVGPLIGSSITPRAMPDIAGSPSCARAAGAFRDRTDRSSRDLAVALEVFASVMDHYKLEVVSDSRDAGRLFAGSSDIRTRRFLGARRSLCSCRVR